LLKYKDSYFKYLRKRKIKRERSLETEGKKSRRKIQRNMNYSIAIKKEKKYKDIKYKTKHSI